MSSRSPERQTNDWKEDHSGGRANAGYVRWHMLFGKYRHLLDEQEWSRFPGCTVEEQVGPGVEQSEVWIPSSRAVGALGEPPAVSHIPAASMLPPWTPDAHPSLHNRACSLHTTYDHQKHALLSLCSIHSLQNM